MMLDSSSNTLFTRTPATLHNYSPWYSKIFGCFWSPSKCLGKSKGTIRGKSRIVHGFPSNCGGLWPRAFNFGNPNNNETKCVKDGEKQYLGTLNSWTISCIPSASILHSKCILSTTRYPLRMPTIWCV